MPVPNWDAHQDTPSMGYPYTQMPAVGDLQVACVALSGQGKMQNNRKEAKAVGSRGVDLGKRHESCGQAGVCPCLT